jgi:hypothetical protein
MNSVIWTKQIREELKCGIIEFYALQYAFEITITRLVGDDRFSLTKNYLFSDLEVKSDELLSDLINEFKAKHTNIKFAGAKTTLPEP